MRGRLGKRWRAKNGTVETSLFAKADLRPLMNTYKKLIKASPATSGNRQQSPIQTHSIRNRTLETGRFAAGDLRDHWVHEARLL